MLSYVCKHRCNGTSPDCHLLPSCNGWRRTRESDRWRRGRKPGTVRHEPGKNYHFPSISTTTILQAWGQKCQVMAGVNNPSSAFTIVAFGVASSEDRPSWSGPQDPSGSSSIWKEFNVAMLQCFANVRNSDTSQPLEAEKKHCSSTAEVSPCTAPKSAQPKLASSSLKKKHGTCVYVVLKWFFSRLADKTKTTTKITKLQSSHHHY